LEFEERTDAVEKIFTILGRIIQIPMHQYARYFEKYRQLAQSRQLTDLVPADILAQLRMDLENEGLGYNSGRPDHEVERDLRTRIDNFHLEVFHRTQAETTKRWTYESEIKRPYFHVTDIDEPQLANWRKYLDYEESEGDFIRAQFLYERCLVACAQYDEFWLRYARWMLGQPGKEEEVRNIYQRASCFYVPIALPQMRLQYAFFEEMSGRVDVAKDIHEAILVAMPGHVETIVSLANMSRRHGGLEAAIEIYKAHIDSQTSGISAKAALVAEWARLLWKIKGSPNDARQVYQKNQHWYHESMPFWSSYLKFELEQPTSAETEQTHYQQIKHVADEIQMKSKLPSSAIQELLSTYMVYLLERGTKDAAKEYMTLDREINGPASVQNVARAQAADVSKDGLLSNGQVGHTV
jgi:pre-mRNA-processing factor 39